MYTCNCMFVRNIYEVVGNFLLWNGEYCGGLIRRMDRKEQMMTRTVRPQSCYLCAMVCHLPRCASLSARPQRTRDCMQSLNNCIFFFSGRLLNNSLQVPLRRANDKCMWNWWSLLTCCYSKNNKIIRKLLREFHPGPFPKFCVILGFSCMHSS